MKVVFDTNVLLDAIAKRENFKTAEQLILAAANKKIKGIITANTITDIYYIAKKAVGILSIRQVIMDLLTLFDIAKVDRKICMTALNLPMSDFEDAVLAACASREGADYIVTRDNGFLAADSPVPTLSPDDLLALIQ